MNFKNVLQSVVDTWLPAIGIMGALILLVIVVSIYKRKQN